MPRTITTTLNVLVSQCCGLTPQDLETADPEKVAHSLAYWPTHWAVDNGYSIVGSAEVAVTLHDTDTVLANKVEALRAEQAATLAEAQAKATKIERQIQQLLAITHEA